MAGFSFADQPAHLDPSELGSREYWDQYYNNDLKIQDEGDDPADLTQLESWFDDVDAPQKILGYITSETFPLSPTNPDALISNPSVLDVGCGNGSTLFELKLQGEYSGKLVGVDYSHQSIDFCRQLWSKYLAESTHDGESQSTSDNITFVQFDIIKDVPKNQDWLPPDGFDLVLDKGTFDAISLSTEMTQDLAGNECRVHEAYPGRIARLLRQGGFLLVTSCNWTEDEVVRWFTQGPEVKGVLSESGRVKYKVVSFGGRTGQAVASVCFRKVTL